MALLGIAFRRLRWILVPMSVCIGVGVAMAGFLGLAGWPVTVVSANFIAVLLVITLSLCVHLIVRAQELGRREADAGQRELLERRAIGQASQTVGGRTFSARHRELI